MYSRSEFGKGIHIDACIAILPGTQAHNHNLPVTARRQTTAYSALCTCSISVTDSHSSLAHAARPPLVRCAIWIAHAKNFYPLTFFPPFHNYYIVSLLHHPGQPV